MTHNVSLILTVSLNVGARIYRFMIRMAMLTLIAKFYLNILTSTEIVQHCFVSAERFQDGGLPRSSMVWPPLWMVRDRTGAGNEPEHPRDPRASGASPALPPRTARRLTSCSRIHSSFGQHTTLSSS